MASPRNGMLETHPHHHEFEYEAIRRHLSV